jgi:hypothetical protein
MCFFFLDFFFLFGYFAPSRSKRPLSREQQNDSQF